MFWSEAMDIGAGNCEEKELNTTKSIIIQIFKEREVGAH
jgi:hypothetical protein